jgi:gluconolactonase
MPEWRTIIEGLSFPEGPVVCADGSVIVAEIPIGRLTRVLPDGTKQTVAEVGGGPNGLAVGPDGLLYVCNNGGMKVRAWQGMTIPAGASDDYVGGSIQRVDVATGSVETLYTEAENAPIRAPNDIVFDEHGGFWFTDNGKSRGRDRDVTGVFYAKADGSACREVIFPMAEPNGIGLSADGSTLYVAETPTASLWAFDIVAPGEVALDPSFRRLGGRFVYSPGQLKFFDSLAVQADGMICVATIGTGGITTIAADGSWADFVPTDDPFTTNLAFGGASRSDAYVTLSGTGRLVTRRWPSDGLCLPYQDLL